MVTKTINTDFDMGNASRIINLPAPVNPNDAARLADVGGGGGSSLFLENIQSGSTYTIALTDVDKMVTATGATPLLTLPLYAVTAIPTGAQLSIRHSGTGTLTVNITGAGTINGVTAGSFDLENGQEVQLWKTGTNAWETVLSSANIYGINLAMNGLTFY